MSSPSSFSSISFKAELSIKFRKRAFEKNKTNSEYLEELMNNE
tara:strand:- start:72 stop:200 length:129 start_codon:yes stop_codon:yes gene_type:complete